MLIVALFLSLNALIPIAQAESDDKIHKIEQFVEEQREISQIPGISLVIVEKGKSNLSKRFLDMLM